jgi:hypothetical protein
MEHEGTATTVLAQRPMCDICGQRQAAIDGRTKSGRWAFQCVPCYEVHGVGLGVGKGQRLLIDPP